MRFPLKLAVLAAAALGVFYLGTAAADESEKIKDVKGCMAYQNKVRGDLPKQLKARSPDWDAIQKETKDWVAVAETLGKQKPPKGTDDSWKTQTEKYLTNVKAVDDAAGKKDTDSATPSNRFSIRSPRLDFPRERSPPPSAPFFARTKISKSSWPKSPDSISTAARCRPQTSTFPTTT